MAALAAASGDAFGNDRDLPVRKRLPEAECLGAASGEDSVFCPSLSGSSCSAIAAGLSGAAARIAARRPQMRRASEEPDPDVLVAQADANLQRCVCG